MVLALASLAVLAGLAVTFFAILTFLADLACFALLRSSRAACRLPFLFFASATFLVFASATFLPFGSSAFLLFASAVCVFALPRRETYSWPSIGATWGGSLSR